MGGSGTKLGCKGLPLDMTAGKTQRDAGSIHTERVGKLFLTVGQDVRRCLICERLFTRRTASEHAKAACHSVQSIKLV